MKLCKTLAYLAFIFLTSLHAFSQADTAFHIFLMFGQSNMEGQGAIETQDRVTNPRVLMLQNSTCPNLNRTYGSWYTAAPPLNRCWGKLGPGDSFGKIMGAKAPAHVKIGLVNVSVSGCNIYIYKKGCPNGLDQYSQGIPFDCGYTWLLDLAKKAQEVGVIKGILLHQGETNNGDPEWKNTVKQIIEDLKTDLNLDDIPFLAGETLYEEYGSCCSLHNIEINKLPGLIPNAHVISAKGLPGSDYAHFTSASYRTLGERYARKMLHLLYNICDSTTIETWYRINGSPAIKGNKIITISNTNLELSPRPENALGTWNWSGAGTSGNSRRQTASTSAEGTDTAIVIYTNECGTSSRLPIEIVVCDSTLAQGWHKIDSGDWIQQPVIHVLRNAALTLRAIATDSSGSWSWTGSGVSGTGHQVEFNTNSTGELKAMATYLNNCGTKTRLTFTISVCDSTIIESWYKLNGESEVKSDTIIAEQNSQLLLSPHPVNASGTWSWSGFISSSGREQSVNTDTIGSYTASVNFVNQCGIPSRKAINIEIIPVAVSTPALLKSPVRINPNPAVNGKFTISGIESIIKIDIIDFTGSVARTIVHDGQASIDISIDAGPGIYLLRLYDGKSFTWLKIALN